MRQRTILFVSLVAGTVLFNACSDTTQPTPASDDKVGFDPLQQPDDPVALVRNIPGFGGFFFDREGVPTVYLRDVSARAQVERALGPWLAGQGLRAGALRVRRADYDWASLERWQGRATGTALAMRGAVSVDADEARNRVTIGVERGMPAAQVRSAVARLGVPSAAVVVEEVAPVDWPQRCRTASDRSWEPSRSTSIPIRRARQFRVHPRLQRDSERPAILHHQLALHEHPGRQPVNAVWQPTQGACADADRERGGRSGVHHRRQLIDGKNCRRVLLSADRSGY